MNVALVSCSKNKKSYQCKAKEMYSESTLFAKATNYINSKNYDQWFILSAKYGLLLPSQEIETYDLTLNNMNSNQIKQWSQAVFEQLKQHNVKSIDFYAGDKYRKFLIPLLESVGIQCNIPLKGLGIGQQLQFYTKQLGGRS